MDEIMINEINQIQQEITEVTNYLYQQKPSEAYKKLDGLLGNIMTVIDKLYSYKATGIISFDENTFVNALTSAMNAIEEKDGVMLADILTFEISAQLNEIINRE